MKINARVSGVRETGFVEIAFDALVGIPGVMEKQEMTFEFGARYEDDSFKELRIGDTIQIEFEAQGT